MIIYQDFFVFFLISRTGGVGDMRLDSRVMRVKFQHKVRGEILIIITIATSTGNWGTICVTTSTTVPI